MEKRRESGFEAVFVSQWTEEVETGCFNPEQLRGFDKRVPDTPAFSEDKAAHQFTSAEEALAFLKKICAAYSGVYLYELKEQGGCPVVIFTKEHLDDAETLDEALQRLAADGRLKALYQAQLHGNEPLRAKGRLRRFKSWRRYMTVAYTAEVLSGKRVAERRQARRNRLAI